MFGKTQRGVTERSNKPKPSLVPKWLGMLVVILLVIAAAVAVILWKPWAPVPANSNEVRSEHYKEETNKDYRFYDLLPQQQVTPIPQQAVPEAPVNAQPTIVEAPQAPQPTTGEEPTEVTSTAPAETKPSYILQVRSYADPDSADARRAEILLNGLSADVIKTTDNGKVWYRVISGPYESQSAAVIAQKTLQNSGIDSIVVKR
ncbi:SPOR domain-containing protein [Acinetobacter rudis]|uniref:SPOR domain-containing protein n=1 Tax=Acinetobacter rudis TaxID=632955 RepID=A0AAW8J8W4_9GAMM|nr:SPOR domain-containing protein [Acinetobacter rudis]MDQ8935938.1 SPOR domain-containing protein [Acinetobacter rudis]MDQ8953617.1 SPOR domain-containing protein [Acinetobacter rudis]MDQ9018201.1 SPOR domain-containing protein [Acinetobacter rudis]